MAAYRNDGLDVVETDGEPLRLTPQQSLGLGLVLHELGTNAAKHGALAHGDGRLRIWWRKDGGNLRLHWQERGGPPIAPPAQTGFGSRLIETVCGHQLGGTVERNYTPAGLHCQIIFPLA